MTRKLTLAFGFIALVPFAQVQGKDQRQTKTFTYRDTPQGELELIVHYPPGWKATDERPAIVFFFGGGWTNGTVKQFASQADYLASRGMVAVRADYRVKSRHGISPKECVDDTQNAVRWLRAHAADLGIASNRIVASGGSAGGHLAACTALPPVEAVESQASAVSSKPNALVLFNPALKFAGVERLMARIGDDESLGKQISPTLHLSEKTPPALILFGTADALIVQGEEYVQRANEVGARAEMFEAEDMPHGFFNRSPWLELTTYRMDEFLESLGYLEGRPTIEKPAD